MTVFFRFKRPEPSKKGFLVIFLPFLDAAHISTLNCNEMAENRPRQFAYEIFSIKRRFQQFKSRLPREVQVNRRRRASKTATPSLKVVILPLLARVAWKRLQIGTDTLLIITSDSDKLYICVNIDNLEWPWTLKIGVFSEFSAATHIKSELRRNGWRRIWTTCVWHF